MATSKKIPPAVIERLALYVSYLREYKKQAGRKTRYVSSGVIARDLGLTPSTVRQDFTHLDFAGISRRGYDADRMERVLTNVLNMDQDKRLVIVGAGNLGRALALHGNLGKYGFHVKAIVDADRKTVGTQAGPLTVQGVDRLANVVRKERIDIGVIAVPSASAQQVADQLIKAGVRGILNLAFTRVIVPKRVHVVDGRIVQSLLLLSCSMSGSATESRNSTGTKRSK